MTTTISHLTTNIIAMKKRLQCLAMSILLALGCAQASTTLPINGEIFKANDARIQYIGRVSVSPTGIARFNYPGVTIKARFQGTSLKMVCRPKTGFFMVSIDGAEAFKVSFDSERDSVVSLCTALPQGIHEVRAMYVIEGLDRKPEFHAFVLDKGCQLADPPALSDRTIEFIGNSITCGFGTESIVASDPYEDNTENHWYTYARIVADSLQARYHCVARSGIGVYRNAGGPKEGSKDNMPWQYPYTLFNQHEEAWDFSKYQPKLVCVNLGTNDFSSNNYDTKLYEEAYRKFLGQLREYYPGAKIVMLTGSMMNGKENEEQKAILNKLMKETREKGDKEIYRFDFTPQRGDLGFGAGWHPSKAQQEKMASELLPFLKGLMGW